MNLSNEKLLLEKDKNQVNVFFLLNGNISFSDDNNFVNFAEKAFYIKDPNSKLEVATEKQANMLQIIWKIEDNEMSSFKSNLKNINNYGKYSESLRYKDFMKSDKTISRSIIEQKIILRFAFGSVETYGNDLVGQHSHPLIDQFFFSFEENDMILFIDDYKHSMKGFTLLHIPLVSNHGVKIEENGCAHYLWIDFIINSEGEDYLDRIHILENK